MLEYDKMSQRELEQTLLDIKRDSEGLRQFIKLNLKSRDSNVKIQINDEYKRIKNYVKDIYHYVQLGKHQNKNRFYSNVFTPILQDLVVNELKACCNTGDISKIEIAMIDIVREINFYYYLGTGKTKELKQW